MNNAASRIAFAAFLHDLGKFAERARLEFDKDKLQTHEQMYCPQVWYNGDTVVFLIQKRKQLRNP